MIRSEVLLTWNGDIVRQRAKNLAGKSAWTIGMAVLSDAKMLCAVNYGYLAASLMVADDERKTKLDSPASFASEVPPAGHSVSTFREIKAPTVESDLVGEVFVGTAVDYGPYVEYGTIKTNAQPFLRPALDMARGKAPTIVEIEGKLAFGEYFV